MIHPQSCECWTVLPSRTPAPSTTATVCVNKPDESVFGSGGGRRRPRLDLAFMAVDGAALLASHTKQARDSSFDPAGDHCPANDAGCVSGIGPLLRVGECHLSRRHENLPPHLDPRSRGRHGGVDSDFPRHPQNGRARLSATTSSAEESRGSPPSLISLADVSIATPGLTLRHSFYVLTPSRNPSTLITLNCM
jgi:hypothetical protein